MPPYQTPTSGDAVSGKTEPSVDALAAVADRQAAFRRARSSADQKGIGQFFTPPPIARFMAGLPGRLPASRIRILDPGAGAGILTAAIVDRITRLRSARHVELVVYETDEDVLPLLRETLDDCQARLSDAGHSSEVELRADDFILSIAPLIDRHSLFDSDPVADVDLVMMNPPYLKIGRASEYAKAMQSVVHGQPNLYALFMSLGAACLRPGGHFISITPRSFANGPYFRSFRRWFLANTSIDRLHLFESRRHAFADSGVLQENVIVQARRASQEPEITISHGTGAKILAAADTLSLPADFVIDDSAGNCIIRIPVTAHEKRVIEIVESWPDRFDSIGLRVSTGPVVTFRATEYVRRGFEANGNIPLLSVQNVRPYETVWPAATERKTLSFIVEPKSERLLVRSSNYALIRRFSAKEETSRLTASPIYADTFGDPWMALENHINYVYHADRQLTRAETDGIVAVLNSRLLDTYFRTISGNTQVNAAEIRAMPFPSLDRLAAIGRQVNGLTDRIQIDRIVMDELEIDERIKTAVVS